MVPEEPVLDGVTVIEVGSFLTAPKPAKYLAEFGAEVIKVEKPSGVPFRANIEDENEGITPMFSIINRGKKNVSLDLRSDEGTEVFKSIARDADVILQNLAPGRVEEFGIGYEEIQQVNDDIIYCSVSGYGQTGPWSEKKSMDYMAQGMSGLPYQNAERAGHDEPALSGWFVADELTSSYVTTAILLALLQDEGTFIDISLLDCMLGSFSIKAHAYSQDREIHPPDAQERYPGPIGIYHTQTDPLTVYLVKRTPERWLTLWKVLGIDEWVENERFLTPKEMQDNEEAIESRVQEQFNSEPREYWLEKLWEHDFTAAPVLSVEEAFEHEQLEDREVLSNETNEFVGEYLQPSFPPMYSKVNVGTDQPPAKLGEHTNEILERSGYSEDEIDDLYEEDVIK